MYIERMPKFTMVEDALPDGTRVMFCDRSWSQLDGHKWQAHYTDTATITHHTAVHSSRGHEVFQYHLRFDDGCEAFVNPWQVKAVDNSE